MSSSIPASAMASFLSHFGTVFQRRRRFGPQQVMLTLMTLRGLGKKTYREALRHLFAELGDDFGWRTQPSVAAFSEARRKLGSSACREGFRQIQVQVPRDAALAETRLGGYLLAAVDMTAVVLPGSAAQRRHFGAPSTQHGEAAATQGRLTLLWDVSFHRPMDWVLGAWRSSERLATLDLLSALPSGYVLLGDRGHPSRRFFAAVLRRGSHFLVRMNSGNRCWKEVSAFLASGQDEALIDLDLGEPSDDQPGTIRQLRLLRSQLPSGDTVVFATSLTDVQAFPAATLIQVYTARWRIEIAIREQKVLHGLELLSARSIYGVYQEVCALMIFQLLASDLEWRVRCTPPPKPPPKTINRKPIPPPPTTTPPPTTPPPTPAPPANSFVVPEYRFDRKTIAWGSLELLVTALTDPDRLPQVYALVIAQNWRFKTRIRPGRSFPRIAKNPNSPWRRGAANR